MHLPRQDESLINEDIAPVPLSKPNWSTHDIAALWIGMAVCIPAYTIASSLLGSGLAWWQAVLTVFLGNLIVLVPMTLNAHPGTAYGIPFPVLLRASFGTRGANITALLRGVVACGWFGSQTWIGGAAVYSTLGMIFGFGPPEAVGWSGISLGPIAGIMIADYHVFRRRKLDVDELYRVDGIYHFTRGFSLAGLGAFLLAVLPNLPGFLVQVGAVDAASVPDFLEMLCRQAWFAGFALGFVLYLVFRKIAPVKIQP